MRPSRVRVTMSFPFSNGPCVDTYRIVSPRAASTWHNGSWYCRSFALVNQFSIALSSTPLLSLSLEDFFVPLFERWVIFNLLADPFQRRNHVRMDHELRLRFPVFVEFVLRPADDIEKHLA